MEANENVPTVVTSANKKEVLNAHKACKVEGCMGTHHAKGFCQKHYKEQKETWALAANMGKPKAQPSPKKAVKPAKTPKAAKPKAERKPNADAGKPHVLSVYFPDLRLREAVLADAAKRDITPGRRILEAVAKDFKFKLE